MLISTASVNTWVVIPGGCPPGTPGINNHLNCTQSRGGSFDSSRSSSWSGIGNYSLYTDSNLDGYDATASYGLDTIALGSSDDIGGPSLKSQVVAGLETYIFYTGMFGLGSQPTNFSNSSSPDLTNGISAKSFLGSLKASNLVPSLSWAYTAGAPYREWHFR